MKGYATRARGRLETLYFEYFVALAWSALSPTLAFRGQNLINYFIIPRSLVLLVHVHLRHMTFLFFAFLAPLSQCWKTEVRITVVPRSIHTTGR